MRASLVCVIEPPSPCVNSKHRKWSMPGSTGGRATLVPAAPGAAKQPGRFTGACMNRAEDNQPFRHHIVTATPSNMFETSAFLLTCSPVFTCRVRTEPLGCRSQQRPEPLWNTSRESSHQKSIIRSINAFLPFIFWIEWKRNFFKSVWGEGGACSELFTSIKNLNLFQSNESPLWVGFFHVSLSVIQESVCHGRSELLPS